MASTSGRMKLGKGEVTIDGKPVAEITDIRLPSKGPAFSTHCLRRKQVRVVPNAVFRRWSLDGSSLQVLIHNLDHQDHMREQAMIEGLRRVSEVRALNGTARKGV